MKTKLLVTFTALFLSGCASVNSYHEPRTGSQPLATVSGSSVHNSLFDWSSNLVTSIDDKDVGTVWSENSKINVVPGYHSFVITSVFSRSFNSGSYGSLTEVKMAVKPSMHYKFVGKASGVIYSAWAVDERGNRVSDIGTSNYHFIPASPTVMPIIITK